LGGAWLHLKERFDFLPLIVGTDGGGHGPSWNSLLRPSISRSASRPITWPESFRRPCRRAAERWGPPGGRQQAPVGDGELAEGAARWGL